MTLSDKPQDSRSAPPDRWWLVAFGCSVVAGMLVVLIWFWPKSPLTWTAGAAVAVFALVNHLNPRHWLKRRSGTCLGIAGACAALPSIAGAIHLPEGWVEFSTAASPALAALFGLLSFAFAWLDRVRVASPQHGSGLVADSSSLYSENDVRTGDQSPVSISNTSQSGQTPIIAGDHATITVHSLLERNTPNPEALALADKVIEQARRVGQLEQQLQATAADNDRLKTDLAAALQRIEVRSETASDPQARAAIEQARNAGDLTQLDLALDAEFVRHEQDIRERSSDWFELCRESAAVAYVRGDINKARSRLDTILRFYPDDLDALNRLGHIHQLCGDLLAAEVTYRRVLELAPNDEWRAVSSGNLGLIEMTRGNLDKAEAYLTNSLAICEKNGLLEGMASDYGNLGLIQNTRGHLNEAELYLKKSLSINEKLDRQEGMANQYGNLGLVEKTRGNLDGAEIYLKKSLAISKKLGHLEGMASCYGNLGLIQNTRGNVNEAEKYFRKSLAIEEKLGRQEGLANQYTNLGNIEKTRGNLLEAEIFHKKSLVINEKLGRQEGIASCYGNLGLIERTRGDLDKAKTYFKKSLMIEEKLGRQEGMANQYGCLGLIEFMHGNLDEANAYLKMSLSINEKLGRLEGLASDYGNLGLIEQERGNLGETKAHLEKSLAINEKLGRQEGVASCYGNLGIVALKRGDINEAQACLQKSLTIHEKLGLTEGMANQYSNLGILEKTRGRNTEAERFWIIARGLFHKIGAKHLELRVQELLDELSSHKY